MKAISLTSPRARASRVISAASSRLRAIGFSQKTCFPARKAAMV